ncbi:ABC transporter permease subunit [Epidermidibacterium keratini]|uniref:ABC transporter permease subunit n=1 Tax=Epidermidibacterium keratini TaxID=1891644 RepID=A0A7M3T543_9ACTN|nr:ABC transporter permease [Epidermidibacterium keratini]QHB98909.1 ABC transporter permease subunit [Epidermidibacterium keratini]
MTFFDFLDTRSDEMIELGIGHILVVAVSVLIATLLGVALGILAFRIKRLRTAILAITGAFLTIPSFALFVLMLPLVGLGTPPVLIALTMYGLLPIVRNTITGLTGVDPAIVESAQGMGLNARQRLLKIQLPMAWPVIMTGIRVTTIMLVGIAAIGAIVLGPGYGNFIYEGLGRVGTPVAMNLVMAGIIGVVVIAILFDALFSLIGRLTTSKGLR